MTTREEILNKFRANIAQSIVNKVDYESLDKFVAGLISGFAYLIGKETMIKEIDSDSSTAETSIFFTHIIEVGSLKILLDNDLLFLDEESREVAIILVSFSMNISLAKTLSKKNIFHTQAYYNENAIETLIMRIKNHVSEFSKHNDKRYISSLIDDYLYSKI